MDGTTNFINPFFIKSIFQILVRPLQATIIGLAPARYLYIMRIIVTVFKNDSVAGIQRDPANVET